MNTTEKWKINDNLVRGSGCGWDFRHNSSYLRAPAPRPFFLALNYFLAPATQAKQQFT